MSGSSIILEKGAERKLQELARHRMIERLYSDILIDVEICEIEGWDKMEYIRQLQDVLNALGGSYVRRQR